jgi:hypothetical protein
MWDRELMSTTPAERVAARNRALRELQGAAHTAILAGATMDEVLAYFEAGTSGALDMLDTERQALDNVRELRRRHAA